MGLAGIDHAFELGVGQQAVRDKIVPGLSAIPSIAVTQPLIDKPYPEAPENERPSHQVGSEPITQIRDVPASGVMQ